MIKKHRLLLFYVTKLEIIKKISHEIYIIALPAIMLSFHASKSDLSNSSSFFLIGVFLSQLILPLLNIRYFYKQILVTFLMLYIIGAVIGFLAFDVFIFKIGIFFIGFGIGHANVISKLLIYTENKNDESKTIVSYAIISFFATWAPALAMLVGGHLSHSINWRLIFVILIIIGMATLIMTIKLDITKDKNNTLAKDVFKGYWQLLKQSNIIIFLLGLSILASGPIVFYINGIYIFNDDFKLPLYYFGHLVFILVAVNLIGKLISAKLINHITDTRLVLYYAIALIIVGAIGNYCVTNFFGPVIIIIIISTYMMVLGGIISISRVLLFKQSQEYANYMASLVSFSFSLMGAMAIYINSKAKLAGPISISVPLLIISVLFFICTCSGMYFTKSTPILRK